MTDSQTVPTTVAPPPSKHHRIIYTTMAAETRKVENKITGVNDDPDFVGSYRRRNSYKQALVRSYLRRNSYEKALEVRQMTGKLLLNGDTDSAMDTIGCVCCCMQLHIIYRKSGVSLIYISPVLKPHQLNELFNGLSAVQLGVGWLQ